MKRMAVYAHELFLLSTCSHDLSWNFKNFNQIKIQLLLSLTHWSSSFPLFFSIRFPTRISCHSEFKSQVFLSPLFHSAHFRMLPFTYLRHMRGGERRPCPLCFAWFYALSSIYRSTENGEKDEEEEKGVGKERGDRKTGQIEKREREKMKEEEGSGQCSNYGIDKRALLSGVVFCNNWSLQVLYTEKL